MLKELKKFSQLNYQEELIERLSSENVVSETGWIYFLDKQGKVWKISAMDADFIDSVSISTALPKFSNEKVAIANIQEKEILLIDMDAYISQKESVFRNEQIPSNYKCITLKNESIGLLVNILASYIPKNSDVIEAIDVKKLLKSISNK